MVFVIGTIPIKALNITEIVWEIEGDKDAKAS